jgi:hypothetical protein
MLDPKEEARFAELKDKCRELKVPAPPEIMIGLQVHEGGVLTFDDIQRGHSWLRNFYNGMVNGMFSYLMTNDGVYAAGSIAGKLLAGGVSNTADIEIYSSIFLGTDDTAFSAEQYKMIAPIVSGNGAGQLLYSAVGSTSKSYNAGTHIWTFTFSRIANNNSGSSITVKEVGVGNASICNERSVLSPTVAVANGAQLTVTYEISMDFSAID